MIAKIAEFCKIFVESRDKESISVRLPTLIQSTSFDKNVSSNPRNASVLNIIISHDIL